jgi:predicted O-linked N-acetylglucosamine transferase (SPINDLY family)
MLQKFHPDFDEILAGVLRRDPRGLLILIHGLNRRWDELLLLRFSRTMPDLADRVRFLDRMSYENFLSLTRLCDVMLDPVHFGGGNTSYEAFAFGVPVVTLPSQFLRGRITLALYKMMGLDDCIARDAGDYVRIASELGCDSEKRAEMRSKILAACDVVYDNPAGVRELEQFFLSRRSGG